MQVRKWKWLVSASVVTVLLGSAAAHANLVANGGFETGDFSGWTTTGLDPIFDSVYDGSPYEGTYAGSFGNVTGVSVIGQTLATVAGTKYDVSFYLMNEADPNGLSAPNMFEIDWNGASVYTLTDAPASGYTKYEFTLTAAGATSDLSFKFNQTRAFWDFDAVSAVVSSVPEPSSFALAALGGIVALGMARRRAVRAETAA